MISILIPAFPRVENIFPDAPICFFKPLPTTLMIDLIATSEVNVSLTIENKELPASLLKDLAEIGKVTLQKNMSIISVVGKGLKKQMGASGKIFSTLGKAGINIEIISQGSSEINISCVIRSQDADKALVVLHKAMIE